MRDDDIYISLPEYDVIFTSRLRGLRLHCAAFLFPLHIKDSIDTDYLRFRFRRFALMAAINTPSGRYGYY